MKLVSTLMALALLAGVSSTAAATAKKEKGKTKPAAVKATPKPLPTDTGPAVTSGERSVAKGTAAYKLGDKSVKLGKASGSLQTSSGFQIAALKFTDGKQRLQLEFMYTGTGPVEDGYLTSFFAVDEKGTYHAWKKSVGTCQVTLEKATPTMVEGTASCPKGLLDEKDRPAKPVTEVKFQAHAGT